MVEQNIKGKERERFIREWAKITTFIRRNTTKEWRESCYLVPVSLNYNIKEK